MPAAAIQSCEDPLTVVSATGSVGCVGVSTTGSGAGVVSGTGTGAGGGCTASTCVVLVAIGFCTVLVVELTSA